MSRRHGVRTLRLCALGLGGFVLLSLLDFSLAFAALFFCAATGSSAFLKKRLRRNFFTANTLEEIGKAPPRASSQESASGEAGEFSFPRPA